VAPLDHAYKPRFASITIYNVSVHTKSNKIVAIGHGSKYT